MGTLMFLIRKCLALYPASCFHFHSHFLLFQVCDVLAMAVHNLVSTFVLGFLAPPWCPVPGGGRGGGPAQLGAGGVDLGSLSRTLSTGGLLPGPEGVVGGEGGCSTLWGFSWLSSARWCWGSFCSSVK